MKTFTRSDVLSWRPCHGKTKTLRIMEGLPRKMTAIDVLQHDTATPADRLWCVLRLEVISERTLRLFGAWCARTTLEAERAAGREPDPRSWHAVETAERYALGRATEDDLHAVHVAAYAAYDAACDATRAACASYARAAYDAARATYDAARADAAYDAARDARVAATAARVAACATHAAAYDAAAYAARAAHTVARDAQIKRLIQMVEEEN